MTGFRPDLLPLHVQWEYLLWIGAAANFIAVLSIFEGLKEVVFSRVHGDGEDPVVGFPQLGIIAQRIVLRILVGQRVEEGVVGDEDVAAVDHPHGQGCRQQIVLSLTPDEDGGHAHDHHCGEEAGENRLAVTCLQDMRSYAFVSLTYL